MGAALFLDAGFHREQYINSNILLSAIKTLHKLLMKLLCPYFSNRQTNPQQLIGLTKKISAIRKDKEK